MSEAAVQRDIVYATHDGQKLLGDLYLPAGKGPHPVLVCVHGGGWTAGARNQFYTWGPYLAQRGYALFAVTYRFASAAKKMFPEAVHDVRAAVQYIRGNAAAHAIDPERIGLLGASAGAQLAALVAMGQGAAALKSPDMGDTYAAVRDDVKAFVGVYGVYDMAEQWQGFNVATPAANNCTTFLGATLAQNRQVYFDTSPISYATTANSKLGVFLVVGTEDDAVNRTAQTDAFNLALRQAGNFVRTCIVQSAPHYFISNPIDEPGSFNGFVAPRLLRFLEEKL